MTRRASQRRVTLVVGTTTDYIEWIRKIAPGRSIFLTDPAEREKAEEPRPGGSEEILSDLADYRLTAARLDEHLAERGLSLDGIACFDCESMDLAAVLAGSYSLPYPSRAAIRLCRSKYLSKRRWREDGLACPGIEIVHSADEGERLLAEMGGQMVLKPLAGSGSEYVYRCRSAGECRADYASIATAMEARRTSRLYRSPDPADTRVVGEEFIDGEEYSCDFVTEPGQTTLLRLTGKIRANDRPFGTIHGYRLCNSPPAGIDGEAFAATLRESAASLQIDRGICMLDFIVRDGKMVLLELAPRPGGDCLPHLLRRARGFDMLGYTLDFARQGESDLAGHRGDPAGGEFVGMRIIAREGGILRKLDVRALEADPRVLEIGLARRTGDEIVMPPDDYDSWILGYVIARVAPGRDPADELRDLDGKIRIAMEGT